MADTAMKPSRPQTTSWLIMTCALANLRTVLANPALRDEAGGVLRRGTTP